MNKLVLAILPTIDDRIVKSKDEIGDLAISFKTMSEKLKISTTSIDNLNNEIGIRKKTEERLRIAEENYRKQFEEALDAIFVIDEQSNMIIDCNPAASSLLERSKEEILHSPQQILYPDLEEDESGLNYAEINHMQESVGKNVELKVVTKDGNVKEVGVRGSLFTVNNQKVVQGIFRDITEMKIALHEKEKLTEELNQAQKLKSIGTLAAGIAHEINTPIQFVGDNINFVQEEVENLFKVVREYKVLLNQCASEGLDPLVAVVEGEKLEGEVDYSFIEEEFPVTFKQTTDGIERIAKIVMAMKNFSHMGRNEKDTSNINEAIESTIIVTKNEWKLVAALESNFAEDLPLVNCFIADINQVIMNLIVNAAHAIKEKVEGTEEKGTIYIETRHTDRDIEISVKDSGNGIPPEARDKIFDPFFTTKEVGEGTGQGLAIAYQVISEKHGGSISFETEVGEGTTFYISIPKK